jgi:hypothetical protein
MRSLSHRFLFIHIPKTAGNAIQKVLLPYSEDRLVRVAPHHDGVERFEVRSPHLDTHKHSTLAEYQARIPADQMAGLFIFHGIRNPWDRCISYYFSPHRGAVAWSETDFARFVADQIAPAQEFLGRGPDDPAPFARAQAVIRYEHLAADLAAVCDRIGIPRVTLPRLNASVHGDYRSYYGNSRLRALVADKFACEISAFGYRFDPA